MNGSHRCMGAGWRQRRSGERRRLVTVAPRPLLQLDLSKLNDTSGIT